MTYSAELIVSGSDQRAARRFEDVSNPLPYPEVEEDEGMASGGRVGLQMGGQPMMEQETMSETTEEKPISSTNQMEYETLRARLPQEITDDVVKILSVSPEAFEDFAMISTQQDVDNFNKKYDVNLVLPAEA